jgi:hypothetical protein
VASTVDLWSPPAGMSSLNVRAWRTFYGRALDVYGITPDQYRLLYVAQRGRCWICRLAKGIHPDDPKAAGSRRLGVDHDHATGAVRGLLCTGGDKTCNRIIGWLDAESLRRAADYLRWRKSQPARVLAEIEHAVRNAEEAGAPLTEHEQGQLAVAFLWPDGPVMPEMIDRPETPGRWRPDHA